MFKVLLADDEPAVIQLLENLVDWESLGYTICGTASNGEDALEILKQSNPHLAIIDIHMPRINGLQLLHQASEILYLRTKFIILSAYNDFEYAKTAMRYGVDDYILKPIDDDELIPALKKVRNQIDNEIGTLESKANKMKFVASNYINRIIKDEISEEFIERCKRILRLDDNSSFRCALVEIDQFETWMNDFSNIEIQKKRLSVRKVIEDGVESNHVLNIFDDDIHRFGIIISHDMVMREEQYLENLKTEVWKNCHCSVSVSLSEEAKGIDNIGKLYRQSLIALQYRLFQMDGGVLCYGHFKNTPLNYNFYESNPKELLEDIRCNNISGINDKLNKVFGEFYKKKCAPEVIESYIKNIEFEMVKHIQDHNGNVDELITKLKSISTSIGKTPVDSLRDDFYKLLLDTSDYYKSISSRSSKDIIVEIKDFVHQNYQKDLKLQQVAKTYFVNPVYIGQVFTKTVGMHFNEYLHSIRIAEAKKLIRRTDMKISGIASMVGYSDSEYFANKFKAITGYLPSYYRKNSMM
ncbi:response regulator [Clostridium estertheticum]|uniref:Stage 0 sporulation protein A homolog n=1 Tax=Clostridium estertheticum TaxID=238834 RepID=A0A7Y3SWJ5_9CLOT|nr:response regulator [Clostridium estertheticum]MBW9172418.1 response regulator [Clostridium estertheticum]NNU76688.1 response regulator [Clostridium estertheticum]WBL45427.1 response regulator [Clostridium estertheticum]WLC73500.1 response regulator [Clostridium estertheticum]